MEFFKIVALVKDALCDNPNWKRYLYTGLRVRLDQNVEATAKNMSTIRSS
jgi:hypothetical protein